MSHGILGAEDWVDRGGSDVERLHLTNIEGTVWPACYTL